jgi:hypothetical protein
MRSLFILISLLIFLSQSSCAVYFPGIHPGYYYVEGISPGPGFVWISFDHPDGEGHNGYWEHSRDDR